MSLNFGQSTKTTSITFGALASVFVITAFFIQLWVALAASFAQQAGANTQNFFASSIIYGAGLLPFGLVVSLIIGVTFKFDIEKVRVWGVALGIGVAFIFAASMLTSFLSQTKLFSLYSTLANPIVGFITTPLFFALWIFINGGTEEIPFIPIFLWLRKIGGYWGAQGFTLFGFGIFHLIKLTYLFPTGLPPSGYWFLVSAAAVRFGLNHIVLLYPGGGFAAVIMAHGFFDLFAYSFVGAS